MDKIVSSYHLDELASKLNGELHGENRTIHGVASLDRVRDGEISWVESSKSLKEALQSPASALLMTRSLLDEIGESEEKSVIIVKNPRFAFAQTLNLFYRRRLPAPGIASTAVLGKNVTTGSNVTIGEYAVIGDNSIIHDNAIIFPHVYLGFNVAVGDSSVIYPFASIYDFTIIGSNTIIHSGSVIGADGFGFVEIGGCQEKVPQVGHVELGDNVEIGANVTIDRATTGITYIGTGTKIDNLVQIGHNCQLGKNCIMVSQSGVAGSCVFGDNVTLAAQAGLAPHVHVGSNVIIAGRSGVNHDIPSNVVVSGFPAKPHKEALRIQAAVGRLPSMMKSIKTMEKQIEALTNQIKEYQKSDG